MNKHDIEELQAFLQGEYIVITESKKTHKQRFLERNKYDPKTGTYETDILDENGKKIRVPLRISATESNKMRFDPETGKPKEIVINRKTAKSKNWGSQITLKHEEGHVAQNMGKDKNHMGRGEELGEAQDYMFKERIPFSKIHGTAAFELDADRYAAEHVSKRSFIKWRKRTIKDSLLELKNIKRKVMKIKKVDEEHIKKFIKNEFFIDVNKLCNELDILIKQCNAELNKFIHKKEIALSDIEGYKEELRNAIKKQDEEDIKELEDLIKMCERQILRYNERIKNNPEKLKEYLDRVRKFFVDPYSKRLDFMINEMEERIKYVDKMVKESFEDIDEMSNYISEYVLDENDDEIISESVESYIDETIERFDAFMEEFNSGQIGDSEFIMESAQDDRYAKITQDYIKKSGRNHLRYKRGEDDLSQEVVDRIVYLCNKLLDFPENGNYNQYKTYYDALCKIVHHPNTTNISYDVLDKVVNYGYINFGMNAGGKSLQHRCHLKPGTRLYHTSENGNLSVLKPSVFIGDDVFYAAPRTYFYCEAIGSRMISPSKPVEYDANKKPIITEEMKRKFKHVYMYTVKPGDSIFFDNELNSEKRIKCGAVYLTYTKPIKLTKIY